MGIVISTVNMKGGVGKTTLTVNLAACLAKSYGKKVLVVDLDSQISATLSLLPPHDFAKTRKKHRTLSYLLENIIKPNPYRKLTIHDIICQQVCNIPNLDLLPGDLELYDEYVVSQALHEQALLAETPDFEMVWTNFEKVLIKKVLDPVIEEYEFIIMDCAPSYNLLTRSGIAASDCYLLPARPEPLSLVGIQLLERRIAKLKESHQSEHLDNLQLLGIVFILSGGGLLSRYYNRVMRRVQEDFSPERLFKTSVPMDINVAKAVDLFEPVITAMPNSNGSKAFLKLTEEFLEKVKKLPQE
ncbi:MAG: ParA family protein [Microcystaceae cyanobacterium]